MQTYPKIKLYYGKQGRHAGVDKHPTRVDTGSFENVSEQVHNDTCCVNNYTNSNENVFVTYQGGCSTYRYRSMTNQERDSTYCEIPWEKYDNRNYYHTGNSSEGEDNLLHGDTDPYCERCQSLGHLYEMPYSLQYMEAQVQEV